MNVTSHAQLSGPSSSPRPVFASSRTSIIIFISSAPRRASCFACELPQRSKLRSTSRQNDTHDVPCKVSCNHCRSPLFDEGRNTVLVYPSSVRFEGHQIPLDFQPSAHIFYEERSVEHVYSQAMTSHFWPDSVIDIPDGVPKWPRHKGDGEVMEEVDHSNAG
jgi:hypothetical protein